MTFEGQINEILPDGRFGVTLDAGEMVAIIGPTLSSQAFAGGKAIAIKYIKKAYEIRMTAVTEILRTALGP